MLALRARVRAFVVMGTLSLTLLGSFQLTRDGEPITGIAYNKARALLAYLAVESDRPHTRESLVGLLWPDKPEATARTNLRQALANLREAIGDGEASPPYLIVEGSSVRFNPDSAFDLDLSRFEALLEDCRNHRHRRLETCPPCTGRMQRAVELYRGAFLEGFSLRDSTPFEEWVLVQRERVRLRVQGALDQVVRYCEGRGAYDVAVDYARRGLQLDPWREEAHRDLMRLLHYNGERSAALAQYETCRMVLEAEFGAEPTPETTALYKDIRLGESPPPPEPSRLRVNIARLAPTDSFVGRNMDLEELGDLISDPAVRLITITGPGGVGKSRLAFQAASHFAPAFRDGSTFVSLEDLLSPDLIVSTIRAGLNLDSPGAADPKAGLLVHLRGMELLLTLDGYEPLLPEVGLLGEILTTAPGITLLITSRHRLGLQSEWIFALEGLDYPREGSTQPPEAFNAVQLFMDRAQQVRRRIPFESEETQHIAKICRLVEGMPLAIEIAAGALLESSGQEIAERLENHLSGLTLTLHDRHQRHRSLWATMQHSWDLLSQEEQRALGWLSVMRGWDPQTAESMAGIPAKLLEALADKSLIQRSESGRYDMHELVRQYAGERLLEVEEIELAKNRHLETFMDLAQAAEGELIGSQQGHWLNRLDLETDNLRSALDWALSGTGTLQGLHLAASLWRFWLMRGRLHEGRSWLERTLEASPRAEPSVRAHALAGAGVIARTQGQLKEAQAFLEEALSLRRELKDDRGVASCLNYLGLVALDQGELRQASTKFQESLSFFRELNLPHGIALNLYNLGMIAMHQDQVDQAESMYLQCLALGEELNDRRIVGYALNDLGLVALDRGDLPTAESQFRRSLEIKRKIGDQETMAWPLEGLARVAHAQGRSLRAARLLSAAEALRERLGMPLPVVNRPSFEELRNALYLSLSGESLNAAWVEGRSMGLGQVIQDALEAEEAL